MKVFANATGNGIKGNRVAVYQDTYLELIESTNKSGSKKESHYFNDTLLAPGQLKLEKTESKAKSFMANRPFLFVFEINRHIVALGRIKDPHWCKTCR